MITRREFAGYATCAICAASELIATGAVAQGTAPAATAGVTRKILSQTDGPTPGYVTIIVDGEIDPGVVVARHTHPGIESGYIIDGSIELPIQGQPARLLKAGDAYQVPAETPHAGGAATTTKVKFTATYVVEKGKPLASPA